MPTGTGAISTTCTDRPFPMLYNRELNRKVAENDRQNDSWGPGYRRTSDISSAASSKPNLLGCATWKHETLISAHTTDAEEILAQTGRVGMQIPDGES